MALPDSEYGLIGFANQRDIEEILIFAVWIGHIGGLANFAFMVILAVDIDVVPVQGCGRKWIERGGTLRYASSSSKKSSSIS